MELPPGRTPRTPAGSTRAWCVHRSTRASCPARSTDSCTRHSVSGMRRPWSDPVRRSLVPVHEGLTHRGPEVDVLAVCLPEARPDRLATDIHHRVEIPRDAEARISSAVTSPTPCMSAGSHVAACADGLGEQRGPEGVRRAVDGIDTVQHRDLQARLLRGDVLDLADDLPPVLSEYA